MSQVHQQNKWCLPTKQVVHQQSKRCTNKASDAPTKQVVHQQNKWCTNKTSGAPNKASDALIKQAMHQQNKWCTNKAIGALETSAPPKRYPSKKILAKCLLVSQLMRIFTPRNRNPHAERVLCGHRHYYPYILLARA